MVQPRVLIVTFPAQGHINPALQFAKRLIGVGVDVTFVTSLSAHRRMAKNDGVFKGLTFHPFSDGYDGGYKRGADDHEKFISQLRSRGSETLREIIATGRDEGRPINCLAYSFILTWAADVARECHVPSALLWIQPVAVFDVYHHYFNGFADLIGEDSNNDPSWSVKLPNLPPLAKRDLPSFLLPTSNSEEDGVVRQNFKNLFDELDKETNPTVIVNTFDALEPELLTAIERLNFIPIGPLIPSAFLDPSSSDTSFGGDMFQKSDEYLQWLNSNPESSVVYISFGSLSTLTQKQMEEIGRGLLQSGKPFLWVITDSSENREEKLSFLAGKLEGKGMIVGWCNQLEVLSHPSIGCFVTHCGWNSSLESLVSGVPMVAFPQWSDQATNAKLIEDVWKSGVRVTADEEGLANGEEIQRCIETVMGGGEKGEEMRNNAKKWKDLGRKAWKEGGSSYTNLRAFVAKIGVEIEQGISTIHANGDQKGENHV